MPSATRLLVALSIALGATPVTTSAQVVLLQPGVHVRIPELGEGTITQRSADSLNVLTNAGVPLSLPLNALSTVEVRGPKRPGAGAVRGAWIGGGSGLVLGLLMWAAGDSAGCKTNSQGNEYDCTRKFNAADAGFTGAAFAAVGAGIGALIGRRVWRVIDLRQAEGPRVYVLPARRLAVAVRLR
jgi:hypothetical protein